MVRNESAMPVSRQEALKLVMRQSSQSARGHGLSGQAHGECV